VGYLGFCLPNLLCFILETLVPEFRGILSSPTAPDGTAVSLQADKLLTQLLQTPFVVPFLGFSTKIQMIGSFFGLFSVIYLYLL
jgi:hypothetical protein